MLGGDMAHPPDHPRQGHRRCRPVHFRSWLVFSEMRHVAARAARRGSGSCSLDAVRSPRSLTWQTDPPCSSRDEAGIGVRLSLCTARLRRCPLSYSARASSRAATTHPALQPAARPPCGGSIGAASTPLCVSSQEVTEFEFHISPVPSSSRPHTGVGTDGTRSRSRWALAGSTSMVTVEVASPWSGMTPAGQRRIS